MRKRTPVLVFWGLLLSALTLGFAAKPAKEVVWVVSPDGSKQCGFEIGNELDAGSELLKKAGIEVQEARKANDGAMRAQMCGAPTGAVNAYLIEKSRAPEAAKLGFKPAPAGFPFR